MAYTDAEILAAVRRYAAEHGALNGEPLWNARRPAELPTGSALRKRYGSMQRVAELAGVPYVSMEDWSSPDATRAALIDAAQRYAAAHGSLPGKVLWRQYARQEQAAGRPVPSFASVERHFGNMTALAQAAGVRFERRKPRPHTVNPRRQQPAPTVKEPERKRADCQEFVQFHLSRIVQQPPLDDEARERIRRRVAAELAQLQGVGA